MSQHLKFDSATGKMVTRSKFGEHTEELLQLNDPTQVKYRKTILHTLAIAEKELSSLKSQKNELYELHQKNKIKTPIYENEVREIDRSIELIETFIQDNTGTTPLLRLRILK
ncbi:hypothetical protein [Pseudomonas shahriarae]|uniref:Uncharacterized protein n=1 Tax=Pseudomonas shahriarae TaxID=2745512 RepID=A0ABT5NED5_9PSED|nr:hypothetical protein [Pseudomonas shahriarae]MDD0986583.1 hypothetical protein [Pseudomonas shahriarae]MDD1034090.1 hypothetical protein [Pseudomonas shahriarae]